jgi:uncharacterized membrane protein SpoIIM required for sporulation
MEKVLNFIGFILIVGGIIGGIVAFNQVDFESYELAKEVADELFTNEIAQAQYQVAQTIYISQLSLAISVIFGGIVSGVFFLGFSELLKVVTSSRNHHAKAERKLDRIIELLEKE